MFEPVFLRGSLRWGSAIWASTRANSGESMPRSRRSLTGILVGCALCIALLAHTFLPGTPETPPSKTAPPLQHQPPQHPPRQQTRRFAPKPPDNKASGDHEAQSEAQLVEKLQKDRAAAAQSAAAQHVDFSSPEMARDAVEAAQRAAAAQSEATQRVDFGSPEMALDAVEATQREAASQRVSAMLNPPAAPSEGIAAKPDPTAAEAGRLARLTLQKGNHPPPAHNICISSCFSSVFSACINSCIQQDPRPSGRHRQLRHVIGGLAMACCVSGKAKVSRIAIAVVGSLSAGREGPLHTR